MSALPPISDLSTHLGYWLRYLSNHLSQSFAAKLAGEGVTVAEWVLLRSLYGARALAPSRLADEMGMTRGAITKLADRLITKQLVLRRANPDDGRAQTLELTPSGAELVPALAALADQNDAEFFQYLTPAERATMERLLRRTIEKHGLTTIPIE